jgi:hypothetical protein
MQEGDNRKRSESKQATTICELEVKEQKALPKLVDVDTSLLWRSGYKDLRDVSRENLEKRISGIYKAEKMLTRRIQNAEHQLKQMNIAHKVYARELRRFKERNFTISSYYFFNELDRQIYEAKEQMR